MWLFTKYGFFSAVAAKDGDGKPDKAQVMVRARTAKHLQALRRRFPKLLPGPVRTYADADYGFRVFAKKRDWATACARLARETDYTNFKSEVAKHHDKAGFGDEERAYEKALLATWQEMGKLQWGASSLEQRLRGMK